MEAIPFGTGIYSVPQAARMLQVPRRTVARWFRGYHYRPAPGASQRIRPPVGRATRDLPLINNERAMSFLEFEELVVVAAFVRKGLSLQYIRAAANQLMTEYNVDRPFAYKRIFTDGADIFLGMSNEVNAPDLIKLTKAERLQIRAGSIDESFVEEIKFSDKPPYIAETYRPRGDYVPIVVNPKIAFGAPTIEGTRITVTSVAALAEGTSVAAAAADYQLSQEAVLAAVEYAKIILPAP